MPLICRFVKEVQSSTIHSRPQTMSRQSSSSDTRSQKEKVLGTATPGSLVNFKSPHLTTGGEGRRFNTSRMASVTRFCWGSVPDRQEQVPMSIGVSGFTSSMGQHWLRSRSEVRRTAANVRRGRLTIAGHWPATSLSAVRIPGQLPTGSGSASDMN